MLGLLATIGCCPQGKEAIIYIDNSAVIQQVSVLVKNRTQPTFRQKTRTTYAVWWEVI